MLTGSIIFIVGLVVADRNINRQIYTNFRANAQHDSYLTFGDSTFSYPLKQVSNNTKIQCELLTPYQIPVFVTYILLYQ